MGDNTKNEIAARIERLLDGSERRPRYEQPVMCKTVADDGSVAYSVEFVPMQDVVRIGGKFEFVEADPPPGDDDEQPTRSRKLTRQRHYDRLERSR